MATYHEGALTLYAAGRHAHSGCKSFFAEKELPVFEFLHWCRGGDVLPVITPFCVSDSFKSEPIEFVTIVDAQGKHEIPVQQVPTCTGTEPVVGPEIEPEIKSEREKD